MEGERQIQIEKEMNNKKGSMQKRSKINNSAAVGVS
jgi:hypothetical protein